MSPPLRDAVSRHCKGVVKRDGVSHTTNQRMRLAQTSWVVWIEMAQRVGQSHTSEIVTDIKTTMQKNHFAVILRV